MYIVLGKASSDMSLDRLCCLVINLRGEWGRFGPLWTQVATEAPNKLAERLPVFLQCNIVPSRYSIERRRHEENLHFHRQRFQAEFSGRKRREPKIFQYSVT